MHAASDDHAWSMLYHSGNTGMTSIWDLYSAFYVMCALTHYNNLTIDVFLACSVATLLAN